MSTYGGKGPLIMGIAWAEALLATILILMRVYSVMTVTPEAKMSLYWAVAAWVLAMVETGLLTNAAHLGIGNHAHNLNVDQTVNAMKYSWITQYESILAIPIGKCAVVAFLLQVQGRTHAFKRYFLYLVAGINTLFATVEMFLVIFQCKPVHALWDHRVKGHCDGVNGWNLDVAFIQGSWCAATDLILALYPITIFWNLQMRLRIKIGICVLLGLGVFTSVCGAIKTYYIHLILSTEDPTYDFSPLLIWITTEMWLTIIISSIPPLWRLSKQFFKVVTSGLTDQAQKSPYAGAQLSNHIALKPWRREGERKIYSSSFEQLRSHDESPASGDTYSSHLNSSWPIKGDTHNSKKAMNQQHYLAEDV